MPTFKITLAYDGTDFVGWQRQAEGTSIQGLLEDALAELDSKPVTVIGAGRTDAGVHARGQVASFALEREIAADTVMRAVNAKLPDSIRVVDAQIAPPTFHARFDARAKIYQYRIAQGPALSPFERRYAWHVPGPLDAAAMTSAARRLEGTHDFSAFQSAGSGVHTAEREVFSATCAPAGELLLFDIRANGFLRHMVRAIVGSLVDVGRGRRGPEWFDELLAARDRSHAGRGAPPHGLFLVRVEYGDGDR
ncbi:MAG TPA: tRNA pseudouridine(38-40) synthase TruA [Vicinamibacterales bacterium]|nr:tRNA pseudouridine(38-40) synthase TruA [Vicinamibacterales bacterium]